MYFQFACSNCGKGLRAREEHIGRRVVCPYCRTQVAVERPVEEPQVDEGLMNLQTSAAPTSAASQRPAQSTAVKSTGIKTSSTARKSQSSGDQWVDGTNVSLMTSCGMGLLATACLSILIVPLFMMDNFVGKLFVKQDASIWVPFATMFLLFWALSVLVLKSGKLKRQKQSMLFDLLPEEYGQDINEDNVDKFIAYVGDLPGNTKESFLINRVKRGLEHFRVRKNASEVATILSSQSDIDANAVESSYTMMNVFIWAIPILGFIGTVIGISAAVGGFQGDLDSANMDALKESLGAVTGGLGAAFDTTLIALVMSMMVMFPSSSIKKAEEDMLNWVDEYCNENLLKRLNDGLAGTGSSGGDATPLDVRKAINAAMSQHHAELKTWSKKLDENSTLWTNKLEAVGKVLAKQVSGSLQEVNQTEKQVFEEKMGQLNEVQQMTASMREAAESLGQYCGNLQTGLTSLNQVLSQLGQQQVVVQQVAAAPASQPKKKRGWFFGGGRNGG